MEQWFIPYQLMSIFGSFLALVVVILYIFYRRGNLKPKIFKMILAIFAIIMLVYGVYQLSVAELLQKVYPGKYYIAGGWIAISMAIVIFISILFRFKEDRSK